MPWTQSATRGCGDECGVGLTPQGCRPGGRRYAVTSLMLARPKMPLSSDKGSGLVIALAGLSSPLILHLPKLLWRTISWNNGPRCVL